MGMDDQQPNSNDAQAFSRQGEEAQRQFNRLSDFQKLEFHRRLAEAFEIGIAARQQVMARKHFQDEIRARQAKASKALNILFIAFFVLVLLDATLSSLVKDKALFLILVVGACYWFLDNSIGQKIAAAKLVEIEGRFQILGHKWHSAVGRPYLADHLEVLEVTSRDELFGGMEKHELRIKRAVLSKVIASEYAGGL